MNNDNADFKNEVKKKRRKKERKNKSKELTVGY
jgi:hypothetical protein